MLITSLLLVPLLGVFSVLTGLVNNHYTKLVGLSITTINLILSLFIFILFDFSTNQFQFVQEYISFSEFHVFLGIDGLSVYFVLLTTIITPIAIISN